MRTAIRKHLGDFIALMALFLIALGVVGYIFFHQATRGTVPLIEQKPFTLKAQFSDAQAVTPGQGQSVRVAGVQIGKITDVQLENGVAVVTMQIEHKWPKKLQLRADATALLRPRTGLKDMFVELDPGQSGPKLKSGAEIPVSNTAPDIDPDEVLSALDTDTRSYLQLLINGAGKGLANRGNDLNQVFKALGPTQQDLKRVSSAIATRRADLRELIHNYGDLTNTLADKDREIHTLVNASDVVFRSLGRQHVNISAAVAKLPPTLRTTASTLTKLNSYARILRPTLNDLRPPFRQLATTNRQVLPFMREAAPILRNQIRPFVRVARGPIRDLRPAAVNLARATPDLTASFHELNRFFDMAAYNPKGAEPLYPTTAQNRLRDEGYLFWVGWVANNTVSLFNTSDAIGPLRRIYLGLSCSALQGLALTQPEVPALTGLSGVLASTGPCGGGPALPTGPTLPPVLKTHAPSNTAGQKAPPTNSAGKSGSGSSTSPTTPDSGAVPLPKGPATPKPTPGRPNVPKAGPLSLPRLGIGG